MDGALLARCQELVTEIRADLEAEVKKTEGMPFTGRNVGAALGALSGCVYGLAGVVEKVLESLDPASGGP